MLYYKTQVKILTLKTLFIFKVVTLTKLVGCETCIALAM